MTVHFPRRVLVVGRADVHGTSRYPYPLLLPPPVVLPGADEPGRRRRRPRLGQHAAAAGQQRAARDLRRASLRRLCVCLRVCVLVDSTLPVVQDEPEPGPRPSDGSQRFLPFDAGRDGLGLGAGPREGRKSRPAHRAPRVKVTAGRVEQRVREHGRRGSGRSVRVVRGRRVRRLGPDGRRVGAARLRSVWRPVGASRPRRGRGGDGRAESRGGGRCLPGAEQAGPGPRSPLWGFSLFFWRGGGGGVSVRAPVAASEREPARRSLQDAAIVIERLRPEQPRERRLVVNLVSILRLRPPAPVVVPRAEQQVTHAPVQGVEPARVAPARAGAKGEGPRAPPVGGEVAAAAQGRERRPEPERRRAGRPDPRGAGG